MAEENLGKLGKYNIIEEIGRGGFSIVYRAEHPKLKKVVAIKLMLPALFNDPETIENFIQEARLVAALKHENITQVIDLAEEKGRLFMVMEYLPGGDLHQWLEKHGKLGFRRTAEIVSAIAAALDYAHSQGIVHGDVKPSNILLAEDGAAKLADFGVLRAVESSGATSADMTRGTPYYISPEQAEGGRATPASDQYALGVVAYELLTGKVPFEGDTPLSIYLQHVREAPSPAGKVNPLVTPGLESVLQTVLAKDPGQRYSDCRAFGRALREAVAATEQEQYRDLINRATLALAEHAPETARPLIESALQIMPEDAQARLLLEDLQQRERAQRGYQAANDSLNAAREGARTLRQAIADQPDPQGVLARLAPPSPPPWKAWMLRWKAGLLLALGLLVLGLVLGVVDVIRTSLPAGESRKATLVSIVRTATPTFTLTYTPTSTRTFTPTSTNTLTSTPTFTSTPTPLVLSGFSGTGWSFDNANCYLSGSCWKVAYPNNANFILTTPHTSHIDANWKNPALLLWTFYSIENCCDHGYIEIFSSTSNWSNIATFQGGSDWEQVIIDLSPYKGQDIYIRFRFTSDFSITDTGWFIQDIQIISDSSYLPRTPTPSATRAPTITP